MGGSRQIRSPLPPAIRPRRQLVLSLSLLVLVLYVEQALGFEVVGQPPEFIEEPAEALGFRKVVFEVDASGERDNLTLNCNASGDPVPDITWFRGDGIEVNATYVQDGTLFIESITEGDYASRDGVNYYCTATNSFGTIRSRTAIVFYAYFDGFTEDPDTVTEVARNVTAGEDVALFCDIVDAVPQPEILWYVDGGVISQSDSSDNKYYRNNGQYLVITNLDLAADVTGKMYRCGVTNVRLFETQMSNTTYVLLNNPSLELTFYKNLENKTAVVGESAEFTLVAGASVGVSYSSCEVEGGPITILQISGTGLLDIATVPSPDNFPGSITFEISCLVFPGTNPGVADAAILTVQEGFSIGDSPSDDFFQFTGDTVSFSCNAVSGVPVPVVVWYFNGDVLGEGNGITFDGSTLTITDTTISHTGMYQCFVSNPLNILQESWALMVRAPVPPEVNEISAPDDCRESVGRVIAEPDGTDALLRLAIIADPCPSVTWMMNGTEIDFVNNTLQIPNDPCSDGDVGIFNFTLNITDVTEGFGNYTAFIENRAGNLTTEVVLVTPEVPAEVVNISFSSDPQCLLENSMARIRCETRGYPQPVIIFFKGASLELPFDDRIMLSQCDEIVINDVEQSDDGLYSCSASNPANSVPARPPKDAQLDYCTEPFILSLSVSDPQPTEGSDVSLDCRVAGTPEPEVEWRVTPEGTTDSIPVVFSNRILETTVDDDGLIHRLLINGIATEDSGVYLCIASNTAGEVEQNQLIEVREEDEEVLSTEAIVGIAAGGAGAILLLCLVILLLVCVYMCARKGRTGGVMLATSMQYPKDYTDGRGNVDRDSDEEDAGEPEAFEPQYQSLPVMRPSQPPQYKPTPQYPHGAPLSGDELEMVKVPPPDVDSTHFSEFMGTYPKHDDGNLPPGYRPAMDDFLSEDAQFV